MKLLLALAAGLLGYCYKCGIDARNKKGALKEEVTRWEGEGGNVPTVATPSPAPALGTPTMPSPASKDRSFRIFSKQFKIADEPFSTSSMKASGVCDDRRASNRSTNP